MSTAQAGNSSSTKSASLTGLSTITRTLRKSIQTQDLVRVTLEINERGSYFLDSFAVLKTIHLLRNKDTKPRDMAV